MSASEPAGGEWCGPTRQLKNSQLLALQHKSRSKMITGPLLLVNKPPESSAVMGSKVDALPEAVVLEPPAVERSKYGSGSMYPVHRDTLRPLRVLLVLLVLVIAAGVAVAAMVV